MNHSMRGADRYTHIRIVAVSLIAGIVVMIAGINARIDSLRNGSKLTADQSVIKASRQSAHAINGQSVLR